MGSKAALKGGGVLLEAHSVGKLSMNLRQSTNQKNHNATPGVSPQKMPNSANNNNKSATLQPRAATLPPRAARKAARAAPRSLRRAVGAGGAAAGRRPERTGGGPQVERGRPGHPLAVLPLQLRGLVQHDGVGVRGPRPPPAGRSATGSRGAPGCTFLGSNTISFLTPG